MVDKKLKGKIIAVDFDGVISEYDTFKGIGVFGKPIKDVRYAITGAKNLGATIVINTCRSEVEQVAEYLMRHEIPYNYINFSPKNVELGLSAKKIAADIYIDDRCMCFKGSWKDTFQEILEFKRWEEKVMDKKLTSLVKQVHDIVLMLEDKGYKMSEIMAICSSAAKSVEAVIQTKAMLDVVEKNLSDFYNEQEM